MDDHERKDYAGGDASSSSVSNTTTEPTTTTAASSVNVQQHNSFNNGNSNANNNENCNGSSNANNNGEEVMELKRPAPEQADSILINEYEYEINRLERLNATLSANLATLLNDDDGENNDDDETQKMSHLFSRRNYMTMELSHDHGPTTSSSSSAISSSSSSSPMRTRRSSSSNTDDINSDLMLIEDQYLYKISKLQKMNTKLTRKLNDKRQLISRLLFYIKTAASKIAEVSKEKDTWRTKFEDEATNNVGKKEMIAVQHELTNLLQLLSTNNHRCEINRRKLLNAYRYDDNDTRKRMECPEEIVQRVVQSLRIGDNVIMKEETNAINEATAESYPLINDYDVTADRKTDLTLLNQYPHDSQQRQHQIRQEEPQYHQDKSVVANEHPLCQQIKSFDRKLFRKTSLTTTTNSKVVLLKNKKDVECEAIEDDMVEEINDVSPPSVVVANDDCKDMGDGFKLDGTASYCATTANHNDTEHYENIGDVKEDDDAQEEVCIDIVPCLDQQSGEKADLNVRAITSGNDESSEDVIPQDKLSCPPGNSKDIIDDDTDVGYVSDGGDDDDDDMYDAREAKGLVMNNDVADNKNNEIETDANLCISDEAPQGQSIDNDVAGKNIVEDSNENDEFAVTIKEEVTGPEELIATILEEQLMKNANGSLIETLEKIQQQNSLKNKDESVDYLQTQHVQQLSIKAVQNKDLLAHRLSRRQLFHRKGTLELCLDVAGNAFLSPGDRQVLVVSKDNDKYMVPRYKPPMLPPQPAKKGAPIFKKGKNKSGYYIYTTSKGENEYAGNFKDGKRHGYGIAKYRNGEVYNGQWRRGNRHGQGVLHLANGEIFDGVWLVNKKNGLGVYYWTDGEVDISWYQDNNRVESLRWTKDRRRAYLLDLVSSKKEPISLVRAASIFKELEVKHELLRNHAQLVKNV